MLNFDGQPTATAIVSPTGNPGGEYQGALSGAGSGISGLVTGKFFGPTNIIPPETAGNFSLQSGATYNAAGIFQGKGVPIAGLP